jgi:hypothetical protein
VQERKLRVEVAEGIFRQPSRSAPLRFEVFADEFLAWYTVHHRPQSSQR